MAGLGMGSNFNRMQLTIAARMRVDLTIAAFPCHSPPLKIKKPSCPSVQFGYLFAKEYISQLRPVGFRYSIFRVLAFSRADAHNYLSI
jgi:hypothetical protein